MGLATVRLIDALGLDPERLEWQQLALCAGTETDWFFDLYESDEEIALQVDQLCLSCPVIKQCALFAQQNGEQGVYGAIYWSNGKPDKAKNSHKTIDIWEAVYDKFL